MKHIILVSARNDSIQRHVISNNLLDKTPYTLEMAQYSNYSINLDGEEVLQHTLIYTPKDSLGLTQHIL